jgi:hypothetical protein
MWITQDEAFEMYARFCRARYGPAAREMVRTRANNLATKGDLEGHRVWNDVAAAIDKQRDHLRQDLN